MSSATFQMASMSSQVVFCGDVLNAKRIAPPYAPRTWSVDQEVQPVVWTAPDINGGQHG
ncbi:Uncharacterised protein [Mycobacteroides abscessus subsp. abscessus]|nr:Uncharacterised protein [Mycobacteroides abscessus subsp. abscessus]SIM91262.1 Uncharacterised protein [Mycobacteroides abscessus subsp. abscessus]SKU52003.1 Uncharacterised protein [Mycobacteroides abscessus subsp. abscessus]